MLALGAAIASVRAVDAVAVVAARVLALRAARPASGAGAVLIVGTATRVARALAAGVGVGRMRGARVRHDAASLVAGQRRWLSGAWARVGASGGEVRARGEPEGAAPQKSHVIPFGQFLSAVENRMISTV